MRQILSTFHGSVMAVYATFVFETKTKYRDRKDHLEFFEVLRNALLQRAYRKAQQLHDLGIRNIYPFILG